MNWNEYFYYDTTSPTCLRWKVDRYGGHHHGVVSRKANSVAGNFHSKPDSTAMSTCVKLEGKTYKVHRIIWEMFKSKIPDGYYVDHLDGNPHNNHIENLECKTPSGNSTNRKIRSDNSSGETGIIFYQRRNLKYWMASFKRVNGKYGNKCFNIDTYGSDVAFKMACDFRKQKIEELNQNGANYTERHGK